MLDDPSFAGKGVVVKFCRSTAVVITVLPRARQRRPDTVIWKWGRDYV